MDELWKDNFIDSTTGYSLRTEKVMSGQYLPELDEVEVFGGRDDCAV